MFRKRNTIFIVCANLILCIIAYWVFEEKILEFVILSILIVGSNYYYIYLELLDEPAEFKRFLADSKKKRAGSNATEHTDLKTKGEGV